MKIEPRRIAWFATKGSGSNEAMRIKQLLADFSGAFELEFCKKEKLASLSSLCRQLHKTNPELLVMEGTGIAGGLACFAGRFFWRIPYVVSSGDAVGPFVRSSHPFIGLFFELYERLLCRFCAGFIGWTPYLCGRALTFGAPAAITAEGWAQHFEPIPPLCREVLRSEWGVPSEAIVVGIIGSLVWNNRRKYCYGMDLVEAAHRSRSSSVVCVIIGDGDGLEKLRARAGNLLGRKVFLPGPIPAAKVLPALSAFDGAVLPQSRDGVGLFRYTTKLSEYSAAGIAVATNRIPAAYDLPFSGLHRLPGHAPWDPIFHEALAQWMDNLPAKSSGPIPAGPGSVYFDELTQQKKVHAFITDLFEELLPRRSKTIE